MNPINCQMRRATVEDLERLRLLWQQADLPVAALEKWLTEFQVAEAADGHLLACLGLKLEAQQGRIHSPSFKSPECRMELEHRLWERVQSVARNHGLWRLWTQDKNSFWREHGLQQADENALKRLPAGFGGAKEPWLVLQLREEVAPALSIEHEFELFKQSQKDLSDRTMRQARALRILAGVIATVFVVIAAWMVWYFLRILPKLRQR